MTQPEKVNYIISKGCDYFGVKESVLVGSMGTKSNLHRKKRYIALILYDEVEITLQEISERLGNFDKTSLSASIRRLREELSGEFYGSEKTKKIYNELLFYLNL